MRFFICGCNGMAGHTIALYLQEKGHDVFGFDLNKSKYINSFACNALDTDTVSKAITSGNYDAVINCIGVLNQFAEQNKALAAFLNSYFPHFLAQITAGSDTQVIHMSTDCVFSGRRGAYTEDDIPDGVSFYDRSKALGELDDDKNITLRNSIVGPDINQRGIGLLNWFLQQKDSINGFTKSMWTGQTTLQLAKTMEAAAMERAHGLYNTVPDSPISKYDLCVLFNKSFRNGRISIHPVDGVVADKSLKRTRYDFAYRIPDYETMVSELADWVYRHKEMYPHYCL